MCGLGAGADACSLLSKDNRMTSQGILGQAVALLESLGWMPIMTAFMIAMIALAMFRYFMGRD